MRRANLISLLVVTLVLAAFCGLGIWLLRPDMQPERLSAIITRQNTPLVEIAEPLKSPEDAAAAEKTHQEELAAVVDEVLARAKVSLVSDPAVMETLTNELRIWLDSNPQLIYIWLEGNRDVIAREANNFITQYVSVAVKDAVAAELMMVGTAGMTEDEVIGIVDERIAAWLAENAAEIYETADTFITDRVATSVDEAIAAWLTENAASIYEDADNAITQRVASSVDEAVVAWLTENAGEIYGTADTFITDRVTFSVDEAIAAHLGQTGVVLTEMQKAVLVEEVTSKVLESLATRTDVIPGEIPQGSGETTGDEFSYVWGEPEFARTSAPPVAVEVPSGTRETYLRDRDAQRDNIRTLVTDRLKDF
ncbi:hypothetical protein [Parasphaerochaeta coccoides]|uniref:Uncharacterized protein n=1 Tax=Parasphaerochaeta coccoides (strain ATCC BAA-1237 / DSM 17374 / SPN1) TaxID=760011 RepID=F4GHF9_PARC1|nr:hypothetical protein [Parasphaerochaeta coccoides]AEC02548.1 hypothetical protein Spico_1342 [Parasphaerochaeta coccoides DSM 17374]